MGCSIPLFKFDVFIWVNILNPLHDEQSTCQHQNNKSYDSLVSQEWSRQMNEATGISGQGRLPTGGL
jgi:hypothetical protein